LRLDGLDAAHLDAERLDVRVPRRRNTTDPNAERLDRLEHLDRPARQ
jgi:hypothetical protein